MEQIEKKIVIPCLETYEFVFVKNIIRFEGSHNYARVHIAGEEFLNSTATIGVYKKILESTQFFCCHKSHIINIQHILRYNKDGFLEMSDGATVPVSRRRKEQFLSEIVDVHNICSVLLKKEPIK